MGGSDHGSRRGEVILVLCIIVASIFLAVGVGKGEHAERYWETTLVNGSYVIVDPNGKGRALKGLTFPGLHTGKRETTEGGGLWLFEPTSADPVVGARETLENVVAALVHDWHIDVLRIPICGSAWSQNYMLQDSYNVTLFSYREMIRIVIEKARQLGVVAIIDNHLWAIGRATFNQDMEDGCRPTTPESCAPWNWYIAHQREGCNGECHTAWECPRSHRDGCSLQNAIVNLASISTMWRDIALEYKEDSGVWFELYNEPYERNADGQVLNKDKEMNWNEWTTFMNTCISAIRDDAVAQNIILVTGLDFGYDFGPENGPIAYPTRYLPWLETNVKNLAYAFHPFQYATCCGQIGETEDLSTSDPYQAAYCAYPRNGSLASGAALPFSATTGITCDSTGKVMKGKRLPPCHWVEHAYNAQGTLGVCAGEPSFCGAKTEQECNATNPNSPAAGGWSRYILPMQQYGPLIATDFGTYDCSTPFLRKFLEYADAHAISYTANAWPLHRDSDNTPFPQGVCGLPSVVTPVALQGEHKTQLGACLEESACEAMLLPLNFTGALVHDSIQRKVYIGAKSATKKSGGH